MPVQSAEHEDEIEDEDDSKITTPGCLLSYNDAVIAAHPIR